MFAATKTFATVVNRRAPAAVVPALSKDLRDRLGDGSRLNAPEQAAAGTALHGTLSLVQVQDGLFLHRMDVVHLQDMTSRFLLSKEGIKVLLKLHGHGRLRIGHQTLHPTAAAEAPGPAAGPAPAAPRATVLTLREPTVYEHRCPAASRERMLTLTVMPHWLERAGLAHLGAGAHLSMTAWTPSPRALCIAEQLLQGMGPQSDPLHGLRQEQQALELTIEALSQLPRHAPPSAPSEHAAQPLGPAALRPLESQRASRLRDWLDSGAADALTMDDIALHMACNTSTLQTQFRQAFGKPIFDYRRESRLRRAADAITARGFTMAQAAELAGYRSQANFATAFRKLFGFAPSHLRAKR